MGRGICSRPRNDARHHRGIRHAQAQNAMHAKLWVDYGELVHAHSACTNCVSEARRGKSGKFPDLLRTRFGSWNQFALAQTVEGRLISDFARGFNSAYDGRKVLIRAEIIAVDHSGILKVAARQSWRDCERICGRRTKA